MQPTPLYARIATAIAAHENCGQDHAWREPHWRTALNLTREYMPSGSGINTATSLYAESKPDRLVFACSFHHMNDAGMYDGWTDHTIIVTPSLASGFNLRITGRDRNEIKDYLADVFDSALRQVLTDEQCGECYARPAAA